MLEIRLLSEGIEKAEIDETKVERVRFINPMIVRYIDVRNAATCYVTTEDTTFTVANSAKVLSKQWTTMMRTLLSMDPKRGRGV